MLQNKNMFSRKESMFRKQDHGLQTNRSRAASSYVRCGVSRNVTLVLPKPPTRFRSTRTRSLGRHLTLTQHKYYARARNVDPSFTGASNSHLLTSHCGRLTSFVDSTVAQQWTQATPLTPLFSLVKKINRHSPKLMQKEVSRIYAISCGRSKALLLELKVISF